MSSCAVPAPAAASMPAGGDGESGSAGDGREDESGRKAGTAGAAGGQEEEEEEEVGLGREEAAKMLACLSGEQLLQLLQDATLRHADVLDDVRRCVDRDVSRRKIFIRGLCWDTSTDSLNRAFSAFGEVEEGAVIMDRHTGRSKGYGFVTFRHLDSALLSLKEPSKQIDGRMTVCRLAATGPSPLLRPQDLVARKIHVSNVPLHIPPQRLLDYFSQYGDIEEGPLGLDRQAGKSRGFALFIYKSAESASSALEEPIKDLDGHQVFCKFAGDDQRQRFGAAPGSDSAPHPAWISNVPYGTMPPGMASSFNQTSMNLYNSCSSPAINACVTPQSSGPANSYLSAATNTSAISPLPQSMNQGYSGTIDPQTHVRHAQYTGKPLYASHMPSYEAHTSEVHTYGGQATLYSGSTMHVTQQGSLTPQTSSTQVSNQYSLMPQTTTTMLGSDQYNNAKQASGTAHGSSYYNMASQTPVQGTNQHAMGSYQNYQSVASSMRTAPTAHQSPHQSYGQ